MSMAVKASDLKTVLEQLRVHPTDAKFTAQVRASLIELLTNGDQKHNSYPELLAETRNFVDQKLSSRLFVPYANERIGTLSRLPKPGGSLESMPDLGLVWCPPGEFLMGSTLDEPGHQPNEDLALVAFGDGFWIGKHEVTQAEWLTKGLFEVPAKLISLRSQDFADGSLDKDTDKIRGEGDHFPMYHVSRKDALAYCRQLTKREQATNRLPEGWTITLPTEAQWEYACRAGSIAPTAFGDLLKAKDANFQAKSTQRAGRYLANRWGIFDMHGNVAEWCLDDVVGKTAEPMACTRGGSWADKAEFCRSASRALVKPESRSNRIGFRIAVVRTKKAELPQ